jgi:hypothetical protein
MHVCVQTTHPMQHQFMVYTAVLICRDKLTAMEAEDAQNYKPSDSLKVHFQSSPCSLPLLTGHRYTENPCGLWAYGDPVAERS